MNRRGNAQDVLLLMVLLFVFGMGFFIINYMVTTSVDQIVNNTQIKNDTYAVNAFNAVKTNVVNRLDYVVFGIMIGMTLSIIITGWFIGGNALFMGIYFLVVAFGTLVSAGLSNAWETFTQRPLFAATLTQFPITNHILLYLPYYIAVIGLIGLGVMFAKPYLSDGGSTPGIGGGGGGHL